MRELRPRSGSRVSIRMLFVFDPRRRAIFLVAGNKAAGSQWGAWYRKAIREADEKYAAYLEALEGEDRARLDTATMAAYLHAIGGELTITATVGNLSVRL